ncbi:hypothetical protein [Streptomyces sp. B6B3]|uniref:hypothetical protein n=1 Tax=Streptomyces sp. B6B3 TaxID=3153570 RepID=UPI00325D511A
MDLSEIEQAVRKQDGYAVVTVKALRDAVGYKKAKKNVVQEISAGLRAAGYGHVPCEIPRRQDRTVVVYRRDGSRASTLLTLVEMAHGEQGNGAVWLLSQLLPRLNEGSEGEEATVA